MEVKYFGANCVKFSTKKVSIVIDDTSDKGPSITSDKDIVIKTNTTLVYAEGGYFEVKSPGEYEVSEVSIAGIASKLHFDETKLSTIYSLHIDGFSVAVLGHTIGDLKDDQLEKLGVVDILVLPVGGHGYTLDAVAAVKLIKEIEPKIVIPTHYHDAKVSYEVEQAPLEEFLKSFGATEVESIDVLKLKDSSLPDKTQVVVLNKQ
jgi:L-ascorbate metabolism protein UlaG (beta-lactamase superfamily)